MDDFIGFFLLFLSSFFSPFESNRTVWTVAFDSIPLPVPLSIHAKYRNTRVMERERIISCISVEKHAGLTISGTNLDRLLPRKDDLSRSL